MPARSPSRRPPSSLRAGAASPPHPHPAPLGPAAPPRPEGGSRPRPAHRVGVTAEPQPRGPEPAERSWTQQPPSPAPQQQVGDGGGCSPGHLGDPGHLGPSSPCPAVRASPRLELVPAAGHRWRGASSLTLLVFRGTKKGWIGGLGQGRKGVGPPPTGPAMLLAPELTLTPPPPVRELGSGSPPRSVYPTRACR